MPGSQIQAQEATEKASWLKAALTLAVHPDGNPEVFTRNYQALMSHYGMTAEATKPACGHENGDCEQAHRRFKEAVEQALLLRGSRDFASRQEYEKFLDRCGSDAMPDGGRGSRRK